MAKINFGGVWEEVVTSEEFPLSGSGGSEGRDGGRSRLRRADRGRPSTSGTTASGIVGQRRAAPRGRRPSRTASFPGRPSSPSKRRQAGTIIEYLLSDAGQTQMWPTLKPY